MPFPRSPLLILLPSSFVLGAFFEWFMISIPIGGQTFYDVAKRKKVERIVDKEWNDRRLQAQNNTSSTNG
jgi:hypothetical protein